MGTDPSCFVEPEALQAAGTHRGKLPVECVSWDDACEFCRRLSEMPAEKAAGRLYRLPTEAQWEYACRAGAASAYAFGALLDPADANFDGRFAGADGMPAFAGSTTPIGSYQPNAWGLFDMHGNAWEWCADWFSPGYYRDSPSRDPQGPAVGFARVLRGGSWRSRAGQCRFGRSLLGHGNAPARRLWVSRPVRQQNLGLSVARIRDNGCRRPELGRIESRGGRKPGPLGDEERQQRAQQAGA